MLILALSAMVKIMTFAATHFEWRSVVWVWGLFPVGGAQRGERSGVIPLHEFIKFVPRGRCLYNVGSPLVILHIFLLSSFFFG